jgi:tetratricopeptide (TPR) repeat protein
LRSIPPLAECFTLASEIGDERFTVIPTFSMGMATLDTSPRGAIAYFERAIALARAYGDEDTEAIAWSTKAMAHARLGEFGEAKIALSRALTSVEHIKSPMTASDVYLFAAWAYLDLGELEEGIEFGQRCVETARAADNMDCM